ncbi:MAG: hypothetical protein IAG13_29870 [Deltaproteobacteria bacterium]|nr:hypothetical protein [Nannocystaceae bacterium]
MTINLRDIPDDALQAEFRRREEIERKFAWSVSLMREFAVWESEGGRARKVTEWHARKIAETLCTVLEISREQFSNRVIAHAAATARPVDPMPRSVVGD